MPQKILMVVEHLADTRLRIRMLPAMEGCCVRASTHGLSGSS